MAEIKPNHICKNINCTKGNDGGRAHYFACDYCTKTLNWRSMACSKECYTAYMEQIEAARKQGKAVDKYPERTDMPHGEVVRLVCNTPMDKVKERTQEQLADYSELVEDYGIPAAVDKINADIRKNRK